MAAAGAHTRADASVMSDTLSMDVVLNGGAEVPSADVVLNGGVDSLPEAVSEDVKVDVVFNSAENQAATKCVGDPFNRVTGSDASSSILTSMVSSLDFLDLDDSIQVAPHTSTHYSLHHYFPGVLSFNFSYILNATSELACFPFSLPFSYNHSSFYLSASSFSASLASQQFPLKFSPKISCFSTSFPFHFLSSWWHDSTIFSPLLLLDSSLSLPLFSPTLDFACSIPSHPNLEFSKTVSWHTSTGKLAYQPFSGLAIPNLPIQLRFSPTLQTVPIFRVSPPLAALTFTHDR